MQFVRGGQSLWIYTILFTSLQHWGGISASNSSLTLPAPDIDIILRSEDSVGLVCRVPKGHRGILVMLYQFTEEVDSQELQAGAKEARFTVRLKDVDSVQFRDFCCVYKNQEGRYSAFSPYLRLEFHTDAVPTPSTPSFPPPVLSLQPSTGVVKRGDMLSFSCSLPSLQSQSQPQSSYINAPVTYVLLWTAVGTGVTSIIPQPQASQVSKTQLQTSVFTVGPVKGGEEGEYACLYQIAKATGLVNSTVSNTVQITVTDVLPVPTLVLEQQTEVWHLLCTGYPAYPGAVFFLYLTDNEFPVATQHAINHQATFPVPVQDTPVALYHCQYSVLLGRKWKNSERSLPLAVTKGAPPQSSPDESAVDLPLILGSSSAVVLFLCSAVFVAVVAQRKVKAAAEENKKRQDAMFWTQVHAKDHVVDLPLRRTSVTSQEWANVDTTTETHSRSPLWNSLSTFTTPIHPTH